MRGITRSTYIGCQDRLCDGFYVTMDNVSKASEIKPPVFDHSRKHVLFPAEFADATGFVHAYPDWGSKLEKQIPFVRRVFERFRSSAPKNQTVESVTARTITEKLLVELLMDGPWKTCVAKWVQLKSPERVEKELQSLQRKKRVERVSKTQQTKLKTNPCI